MRKRVKPIQEFYEDIDTIIPPTDETSATPRSAAIGETYKELEADSAAEEQRPLNFAAGELEARPHDILAAQTKLARSSARRRLRLAQKDHARTECNFVRAQKLLSIYVNRPPHARQMYYARLLALLGGDVAGVAGASLLLGESTVNAFGQAIGASVAAVTLGAIGSETKRQRQGRARAMDYPDLPSEKYEQFRPLFSGRSDADKLVSALVLTSAVGLACIVGAIFALRSTIEGAAAGVTFALIAASVGMASFVNSYTTTCDVAEFLDRLRAEVRESRRWLAACEHDRSIVDHDGAVATARNIRETWAVRGQAAWWARTREKFAILNANPLIVGNGKAPIGRLARVSTPSGDEDAA